MMQVIVNTETLKPLADKIIARLNSLGVVSKAGKPLVVDQGYEVLAATLGHRNQHVMRAALATPNATENALSPHQTHIESTSATGELQQLRDQYAHGDSWGEHPEFPRDDWQREVSDDDTLLGYWEWVLNQLNADSDDAPEMESEPPIQDSLNRMTCSSYRASLQRLTREELQDELKSQKMAIRGFYSEQQMRTVLVANYEDVMRHIAEMEMWDFDFGDERAVLDVGGWTVAEEGSSTVLQRAVFFETLSDPDADTQKVMFKVEIRAQAVVGTSVSD